MLDSRLEFLISQYLDGSLPAEDCRLLEKRLAADPAARALFEQHKALDAAMKSLPLPEVHWDRFAQHISDAAVAQGAGDVAPAEHDDELELAITQYLQGELSDEHRSAVEARVAADPAARSLLAQHRSLDVVLKHGWPLPHVDFDALHQHISDAVEEQESAGRVQDVIVHARRPAIGDGRVHRHRRRSDDLVQPAEASGQRPFWYREGSSEARAVSQAVADVSIALDKPAGKAEVNISYAPADELARSRYDYSSSGLVSVPVRIQVAENVRRSGSGGGGGLFPN